LTVLYFSLLTILFSLSIINIKIGVGQDGRFSLLVFFFFNHAA